MLSDDLGVPDEGEQEWEQPASDPVEPGDIPPWLQVPPAAPRPQPPAQPAEQPAPLRPWEATERPVVMSEQFRPGPPPPLVSGDRQVHAVPLRDLMTGTNHPPVGPGAQPEPQATVRMWSDPGVERGRARGTSIVTVVPKGGTGKSSFTATCAARAATVLAGVNKRVCLVDANAQQSDISLYMGVQGRCATIAAISREPVIDEVTIKRAITTIEDYHLDVIFGSNNSQEVDPKVLSPMLYRRVVATLAGMYDYVFVDNQVAEPFSPMVREFALPAADRIMVVLDHNQVALDRVIHYLQEISGPRFNNVGQDVSLASIGIVLNMYQPQAKLTLDDIRAQMVGWNWWGKVPFMQSWKDANSAHRLCLDKDVQAAIDPILFMATGEAAFHEKAAKTAKGKGGKLLAWLTGEGKAQR
jgi:MinD-like ATPase involved in chromosome partitioning or flagellar assembly